MSGWGGVGVAFASWLDIRWPPHAIQLKPGHVRRTGPLDSHNSPLSSNIMHAIELAKMAPIYVRHTEAQVALRVPPTRDSVHAYWLANRFRHEYWSGRLAAHREAIQRPGISFRHSRWLEVLPVIQEILLSEPLSRCVAYQATVFEEDQIDFDIAPLAHSVLAAHVEARHRCLHLIVFGAGLSVELAVRLNRLRRLMELYTDQLLASLRTVEQPEQFCFDVSTMLKTQQQLQQDSTSSACRRLHTMALSGWLERVVASDFDERPASVRLNHRLSQVLLEMLPQGLFDGWGLPRTHEAAWLAAESRESNETQPDGRKPLASPLDILHSPLKRPQLAEPSEGRW